MKRFYMLLSAMGLGSILFAQSAPKQTFHKPANVIQRNLGGDKTLGTHYVDMEGVESEIIGDVQNFVDLSLNSTDTTNGGFHSIWQIVDTLQVVSLDYTTLDYIPFNSLYSLTVDSVFVILGHQNNSGMTDKIRMRLTDVVNITSGANTYKDWNTVYWSDSISTDTSLTGGFTGTGYPLTVIGREVNTTVPAPHKFGLELTYDAPQIDSLAVRYGYATDGANCPGNAQAPNIITPEIYPSAFYSVTLSGGSIGNPNFTFNLPRVNDGAYYWYIDCDGNGSGSGNSSENPYHYWSIWFRVTAGSTVGVEEQQEKGVHTFNYPNPATTSTTINFTLKNAADVNLYITDLSGKTISSTNLGHQNAGVNNYVLNTSGYAAGIYMYTLDVDGTKISRRLVISE